MRTESPGPTGGRLRAPRHGPLRRLRRAATDRLLVAGVAAVLALARVLPVRWVLAAGGAVGWVAGRLMRTAGSRAETQADRAVGARPAGRACFGHLGRSGAEVALLAAGRLDLDSAFDVDPSGPVAAALAARGPVLWVSGHLGNWELAAAWLARRGVPLHVLAAPLPGPCLDAAAEALRARLGFVALPSSRRGASRALRHLAAGGHLGVLIDHRCRGRSAPVPFLGRPAPTPLGPARLALRARPAVFVAGSFRDADGRHRVRIRRADPEPGETAAELTARWTAVLAEWVSDRPEQWVWMQPRWTSAAERA